MCVLHDLYFYARNFIPGTSGQLIYYFYYSNILLMNYWLVKSEPSVYSWDKLVKDKKVTWDGVRNFAARNHLRAMKKAMRFSSITAMKVWQ